MKKAVPPALVIKRYENRRLYNTLTSQYINQDQVAQLVRDGYEARVVDATTGEDLTRLVLAQIVVEDEVIAVVEEDMSLVVVEALIFRLGPVADLIMAIEAAVVVDLERSVVNPTAQASLAETAVTPFSR